jgi:hypothetical protein
VSKMLGEWYQKTNKTEDTNKVNLFVSSVLCVFWYHLPKVLDTLHICNTSWLRVKLLFYDVTVSYCCAHVTSTIYCSVISVSVIHSYKILQCILYLAFHSCMYCNRYPLVSEITVFICTTDRTIDAVTNTEHFTRI